MNRKLECKPQKCPTFTDKLGAQKDFNHEDPLMLSLIKNLVMSAFNKVFSY